MKNIAAWLLLAALAVEPTGAAGQEEHPTLGQVVDTKESSALTYDCVLRGEVLHCQFAQGAVRKNTRKSPAELDAEAGQMLSSITEEQCESIRAVRDQLASDPINLPTPPTGQALEEGRELMSAMAALCDERSAVMARALEAAIDEKQSRTCTFSVYLFELDFAWSHSTTRWETVSAPQGPCGIVTAAFMEPDEASAGLTF